MTIKIFLLLLIIHTGLQLSKVHRPRAMRTMWHREFGCCWDNKSTPYAKLIEARINLYKGGITAISVKGEVLKHIKKVTKGVALVEKCSSYAETRCENRYKFEFKDICYLMALPNQLWSPVVKMVQPPHYQQCPFKKGAFEMVNVTFKAEHLATLIPILEGHYWRIKITGFEGNNLLCCVVYGGQVATVRV